MRIFILKLQPCPITHKYPWQQYKKDYLNFTAFCERQGYVSFSFSVSLTFARQFFAWKINKDTDNNVKASLWPPFRDRHNLCRRKEVKRNYNLLNEWNHVWVGAEDLTRTNSVESFKDATCSTLLREEPRGAGKQLSIFIWLFLLLGFLQWCASSYDARSVLSFCVS